VFIKLKGLSVQCTKSLRSSGISHLEAIENTNNAAKHLNNFPGVLGSGNDGAGGPLASLALNETDFLVRDPDMKVIWHWNLSKANLVNALYESVKAATKIERALLVAVPLDDDYDFFEFYC